MLPAFRDINDEQRRRNLENTDTRVEAYMIFDKTTGLSTGMYYPHWYGGYLAPAPPEKENS